MLSRLRIGTRLGLAFGIISLLLVACAVVGLLGLGKVEATADRTLRIDAQLAQNAMDVKRLALEGRRFEKDSFINIATPEDVASYHGKWEAARKELEKTLSAGAQLATTDELRTLYTQAAGALDGYANGFETIYQRIRQGELTGTEQANEAFQAYKEQVYQLEILAERINEITAERMSRAHQTIDDTYAQTLTGLLSFSVIALLAATVLAWLITRSITRPLHRALMLAEQVAQGDLTQEIRISGRDEIAQLLGAMARMNQSLSNLVMSIRDTCQQVYSGANELSHASHDLASRTEQQAASLQETAASMEEISTTVRQNTESTQQIDSLASDATASARSSSSNVTQNLSMMREIAVQSQQMNQILTTIDSIAFQTNILALNASVEAARAGEQGRGFAVVASEVRALATRSADSAGQIRSLLEGISSSITSGVQQAELSGSSIEDTQGNIDRLAVLIGEIATASREQINGIEQVNGAISQMDTVTQQNAAMVEQSTAAASVLEEQAGSLQALVSTFKVTRANA